MIDASLPTTDIIGMSLPIAMVAPSRKIASGVVAYRPSENTKPVTDKGRKAIAISTALRIIPEVFSREYLCVHQTKT